jgi:hypothetical protein
MDAGPAAAAAGILGTAAFVDAEADDAAIAAAAAADEGWDE